MFDSLAKALPNHCENISKNNIIVMCGVYAVFVDPLDLPKQISASQIDNLNDPLLFCSGFAGHFQHSNFSNPRIGLNTFRWLLSLWSQQ